MHIIIYNNQCFNVDNNADTIRLLEQGARELTAEEIVTCGMMGFEQYVSPANTMVNADGTVTFTPPDVAGQQKEARRQEIHAELDRIDAKKVRSASAIALAIAKGDTPDAEDVAVLTQYEQEAAALREELQTLVEEN